jgi:CelD/BcsL family acetyltransferase involved in cellulose biosynthesis
LSAERVKSSASRSSLTYEALTGVSEIKSLAAEWDELLERSACNRAFSSPAWYEAALRLAWPASAHVIVARRGGALAGVLPLVLTAGGVAEFPGDLSDYNDIVAEADDADAHTGLLDFALGGARAYERLALKCLRRDSNCLRALRLLMPGADPERLLTGERVPCPYARLAGGYDAYLASRGRKFRSNIRRARRRAEAGGVGVRELRPEGFPPGSLPEAFLSLHLGRFAAGSLFNSAAPQSFVRSALPILFEQRRVRAFALFERDKMIGIHLSMVGARSLCSWNAGFLPGAEPWSPGKLLFDEQIRIACGEGLEEFDLLRGGEAYKDEWATDVREICQIELAVSD